MSTENHSTTSQWVTLRDFKPALEAMLETESKYCLVGGLAVGQWAEALLAPSIRRIAIGDPEAVPAGVYARAHLQRIGLWDALHPKIVPVDSSSKDRQCPSCERISPSW